MSTRKDKLVALQSFDPEKDLVDPKVQYPDYDEHPQDPLKRTATLPDAEQDWTEVHPGLALKLGAV